MAPLVEETAPSSDATSASSRAASSGAASGGKATGGANWRPDIQGMRALAVGLVVLAHVHLAGFEGGYVGVDVFFVISGFLITQLL
ncbi:MAG: acyltransferase family protein, partial [Microbacterium sp.]